MIPSRRTLLRITGCLAAAAAVRVLTAEDTVAPAAAARQPVMRSSVRRLGLI